MRWVHLASALLWPARAAVGLWWARSVVGPRHRRWIYAVGMLAVVIGGENLLQALVPVHPRGTAHLVANVALAAAGVVAVFMVAAYGHGIVVEERVMHALSGGRIGARGRRKRAPVPLTPQETEVITLLCEGLGTDEIARRLGVSPHTATTHIRNLMRKLDVRSRADAVVWAVERDLPRSRGNLPRDR